MSITPMTFLPPVKLKTVNADFVVDEIYLDPSLLPQNEAEYTYLYVQKENFTTFQLQYLLADHFRQGKVAEVEASGLKDEQAITRQIISVRSVCTSDEIAEANRHFNQQGLSVEIKHIIGYGATPVYRQSLHSNKFTITLRNVETDLANQLSDYLQANKFFSFINYYDEQRFGTPDSIHNAHRIGQAILNADWNTAYQEYLLSGNESDETERVQTTFRAVNSPQKAMQSIMQAKLSFFVSSYNSMVWNMALKEEVERLEKVVRVELPWLGEIVLPRDSGAALPAILSVPVKKLNWKTSETTTETKQRPVTIIVPIYVLQNGSDDLHPGKQAVTVTFCLPTGCYATMLLKQLLVIAKR